MIMAEEHAPDTLIKMSDEDLLKSIGALKDGKLTFGDYDCREYSGTFKIYPKS